MLFEIPAGVTDLEPVAKDGWTTSVDDGVAAFTDGVLDHDTEGTFALSFTAPSSAGPIDFPVVQQCGDTELRWIEIPQDGAAEPENPAPRVNVVGEAPPVDTTASAPATTSRRRPRRRPCRRRQRESTSAPTTAAPPAEATTTSVELVIAPAPETTADDAATSTDPGDDGDDGSSSTGWVIVAVIGVAARGRRRLSLLVEVSQRTVTPRAFAPPDPDIGDRDHGRRTRRSGRRRSSRADRLPLRRGRGRTGDRRRHDRCRRRRLVPPGAGRGRTRGRRHRVLGRAVRPHHRRRHGRDQSVVTERAAERTPLRRRHRGGDRRDATASVGGHGERR